MPQSVVPVAVESKEAVQIPVVQQKNTVPPPVSNQRQLAIQCLDEAVKHGYLTKDEKRKILSEQNDHKLSCDITPYFSRNAAARNANLILDEALQLGNVSKSIYEQTKNSFINEPSLKNDPSLREDAVRKYANLNKISAEVERILANEVTKQIIPDDIMKQILDKKYTVETRHALARAYDPSDPYVKETIAILTQKKEIGSRLDIPGETESQKLSYLWHIPSSKIRFDQLEAGSKRSAKILKDLGVSFLPPEHSQEYINFKIRKDFEELTSEQKVAKLKLYYLYQGFSLPDSVNINEFSYIIEELYKDENDLTGVLFKLGKEINRQAKATLKEIESNKFLEDRIIYEILAFENDQENAAAIEQIAKDVKIPYLQTSPGTTVEPKVRFENYHALKTMLLPKVFTTNYLRADLSNNDRAQLDKIELTEVEIKKIGDGNIPNEINLLLKLKKMVEAKNILNDAYSIGLLSFAEFEKINKMNWSDEKIIIINSFLPEVKQANKIEETINRLVEFASLTNNQNLFELRKLPLSERQVVVDLFEQTAGCASLAEKKGLISNQDKTNIFDFLDKKVVSPNLSFPINDIRNGESSIILRQMFVDEFNPKLRIDVKNEIENSLPQEMISKNSKILSLGQHVQTIEKIRNNLTEKLLFEKILTDIAHYQFFDASSIKNIRAQNDLFKQREMIRDYFIKNENDGKLSLSQMMKMRSDEIIKIFANDSNITAEIATIENNLKEDWKREMDTKSFSEEKYKNRAEYVWERYFFLTGLIDKHKTESERYLPLEN